MRRLSDLIEPSERGMWLRDQRVVERFPTFTGASPVTMEPSADEDPTEEVTLTTLTVARDRPTVQPSERPTLNRESATHTPPPPRRTLRPRPSPLFGEGEVSRYTLRETIYMGDRPNTSWETEVTAPGGPSAAPWLLEESESSVTLEDDIPTTPAVPEPRACTFSTTPAVPEPRAGTFSLSDDLSLSELLAEPRGRPSLADRSPAPIVPAPVPLTAPELPGRVGSSEPPVLRRLRHALEAAAWFTAGAVLFGGTGAAFSLLIAGALFAH